MLRDIFQKIYFPLCFNVLLPIYYVEEKWKNYLSSLFSFSWVSLHFISIWQRNKDTEVYCTDQNGTPRGSSFILLIELTSHVTSYVSSLNFSYLKSSTSERYIKLNERIYIETCYRLKYYLKYDQTLYEKVPLETKTNVFTFEDCLAQCHLDYAQIFHW